MAGPPDVQAGQLLSATDWNDVKRAAFREIIGRNSFQTMDYTVIRNRVAAALSFVRFGIITALSSEPDAVTVQMLKMNDGVQVNDGEPVAILVWPNTVPNDYASFIGTNIVVPVMDAGEANYVMQLPRWDIRQPSPNDPRGECPIGV